MDMQSVHLHTLRARNERAQADLRAEGLSGDIAALSAVREPSEPKPDPTPDPEPSALMDRFGIDMDDTFHRPPHLLPAIA